MHKVFRRKEIIDYLIYQTRLLIIDVVTLVSKNLRIKILKDKTEG